MDLSHALRKNKQSSVEEASDSYLSKPKTPPKAHTRRNRSFSVRDKPLLYDAINPESTGSLWEVSTPVRSNENRFLERIITLEAENKELSIENVELKTKLVNTSQELETTLQSWIMAEEELGKLVRFIQMKFNVHGKDNEGEGEEDSREDKEEDIEGGTAITLDKGKDHDIFSFVVDFLGR